MKKAILFCFLTFASIFSNAASSNKHCNQEGYNSKIFICQTKSNKQIKICLNASTGKYKYTYGKRNKPEISIVRSRDLSMSQNDVALEFMNGKYKYKINSSEYDGLNNLVRKAGVSVYKDNKLKTTIICDYNKPYESFIDDMFSGP